MAIVVLLVIFDVALDVLVLDVLVVIVVVVVAGAAVAMECSYYI